MICYQGAGGMKGKGFHVDVVQEHLEKEAEVSFQFAITGAGGQWVEKTEGFGCCKLMSSTST